MSNADTETALSTPYPVSRDWLSELRKIKHDGEEEIEETRHRYAALQGKVDQEIVLAKQKHQLEMEKLNKQLADTIIKHKSKLYSLKSHSEMVQARVAAAASLIAPIHSLPNEILTLIFTFMCSSQIYRGDRRRPGLEGMEDAGQMDLARHRILVPPFTLATVCRRWHDVAHRCPSLWSRYSLPANATGEEEEPEYSRETLVLTTNKLLKLAASHPMSVDLDLDVPDLPSFKANILSLSNRWRELRLSSSQDHTEISEESAYHGNVQLLQCLCGNLQNLECLALDTPTMEIAALRKDVPKLKSLSVFVNPERSTSSISSSDIDIPWNQITKYTASGNILSDILDCVAAATNLETLVLNDFSFPDVEFSDMDEEDLPVICIPTLRYMTAIMRSAPELRTYRALFNCLQGSVLSTLALHLECISNWHMREFGDLFKHGIELRPFLRFLSTSPQTLVSLSLQLTPLRQSDLRFVLGSLPELTTLELLYDPYNKTGGRSMPETYEHSKLGSGLVDALSERLGSPTQPEKMKLVPKLQHLTLQYMDLHRFLEDTEVLDMVRTRCAGLFQQQTESSPLRSAHITIREHHFSSKAVEAYHVLRLAGLCTSLQGKDGYL